MAAGELLDSGKVVSYERSELNALLSWFNNHLPEPKTPPPKQAIFWYKADVSNVIQKTWDLTKILKNNGFAVSLIKTDRPGYIVYEDDYQVGAIPFNDTVTQ